MWQPVSKKPEENRLRETTPYVPRFVETIPWHLGTPNEDAVREALTVRPSASSPPESEMTSSHVSLLKFDLPQWNADDPAFWFKQAEDAFAMVKKPNGETQEVTGKERLTIVGRHLPPKTMQE